MKKYTCISFTNIIDHFLKITITNTIKNNVMFFIDEMVTDSIQNCTELKYVVL